MSKKVIDTSKPLSYEDAVEIADRIEALRQRQKEMIARDGWMVMGIFDPHGNSPSFSYTVGMLDKFGYELIAFALPSDLARGMFNDLGEEFRKGRRLKHGEVIDTSRWLRGNFPFKAVACKTSNPLVYSEYVVQAAHLHGKKGFPVFQILASDAKGLLPDDPGFDEEYMGNRQLRLDR